MRMCEIYVILNNFYLLFVSSNYGLLLHDLYFLFLNVLFCLSIRRCIIHIIFTFKTQVIDNLVYHQVLNNFTNPALNWTTPKTLSIIESYFKFQRKCFKLTKPFYKIAKKETELFFRRPVYQCCLFLLTKHCFCAVRKPMFQTTLHSKWYSFSNAPDVL